MSTSIFIDMKGCRRELDEFIACEERQPNKDNPESREKAFSWPPFNLVGESGEILAEVSGAELTIAIIGVTELSCIITERQKAESYYFRVCVYDAAKERIEVVRQIGAVYGGPSCVDGGARTWSTILYEAKYADVKSAKIFRGGEFTACPAAQLP